MSYGRGPPNIEGMTSLKVDNLTYRTTPEDLRRAFEKYGEVGDVYIPRDRFTRESRGFAFVRFYDKRDAEDALEAMDGQMLDGRELRVQMARYGRPSDPYRRGPPRSSQPKPKRDENAADTIAVAFAEQKWKQKSRENEIQVVVEISIEIRRLINVDRSKLIDRSASHRVASIDKTGNSKHPFQFPVSSFHCSCLLSPVDVIESGKSMN
uniref:Serine/arginine-rich splicing factor 2 n=1 Tax=Strigamia maritima TaxID=126957 RepID=T1J1U9_STRMM